MKIAIHDSSEETEFFSKTAGFYRSEAASKTRIVPNGPIVKPQYVWIAQVAANGGNAAG